MKKSQSLLDRAINVLSWNRDYDWYMQRYMDLFNPNHNNVLAHNKGKKIPGKLHKPDWPLIGKLSHPL